MLAYFDSPIAVNLAALTEDNTEVILNGETLPAGEHNRVRLNVNAECDTVFDSFVSVRIWTPPRCKYSV